jgi:hypothetical protein
MQNLGQDTQTIERSPRLKAGQAPARKLKSTKSTSKFLMALSIFFIANLTLLFSVNLRTTTIDEELSKPDSASNIKGTWPWWISKSYLAQVQAPDIVLLGSSQMATAVFTADAQTLQKALDCVSYRRATTLENDLTHRLGHPISIFNWSMGGAMASDQNLITRTLLTGRLKPKMVVIGISPRDFIDNTLPSASATEPFRFFSRFVEPDKLAAWAFTDDLSRFGWLLNRYLPMSQLHGKVASCMASGEAPATTNKQEFLKGISASGGNISPGQWLVPANIPYLFVDNTQEYIHRYTNPNPPIYPQELSFFNDALTRLRQNGVKVLVVGMPSVSPNRKLLPDSFWQDFHNNISSICVKNSADWLDLSDSDVFTLDDYLDTVHLSARGGDKLFAEITRYIGKQPNLVTSLNSAGPIARLHRSE